MRSAPLLRLGLLSVSLLFAGAPGAQAAPPAGPRGRTSACKPVPTDATVTVGPLRAARTGAGATANAIELGELVTWISGLTCQQFLIPERVRTAKVTLLGPGRLSAGEARRLFLSTLEAMGLTVQTTGRTVKIIEKARAVSMAVPTYGPGERVPTDDRVITRVIPLSHGSAGEMAQLLGGFQGKDSLIAVDARTNALIVTGPAGRLARLLRIIDELTVERGADRIQIYRAVHTQASDLADKLLLLLGAGDGPAALPLRVGDLRIHNIVADDRTQQIFIVASEPGHQRIRRLLQPLDRAQE